MPIVCSRSRSSKALNQEFSDSRAICHECDLLADIGKLPDGYKAACPRCGAVLTRSFGNALDRMLIFALTAIICLLFSNLFGYVNLLIQGQEREISLLETVQVLFELKEWALSAFMLVIIIGLPAFFVTLVTWLAMAIKLQRVSPRTINLLSFISYLRFWNMAEIFFLGILISMVKVASLARVEVGLSFWAYAFFNLFFIAAMLHFDKFQLALAIKRIVRQKQTRIHAV
jgi:paraquat-inducible protein A